MPPTTTPVAPSDLWGALPIVAGPCIWSDAYMHTHHEKPTDRNDFAPLETMAIMVALTGVCVYLAAVAITGPHYVAAVAFGAMAMGSGTLARHAWNTLTDRRFDDHEANGL